MHADRIKNQGHTSLVEKNLLILFIFAHFQVCDLYKITLTLTYKCMKSERIMQKEKNKIKKVPHSASKNGKGLEWQMDQHENNENLRKTMTEKKCEEGRGTTTFASSARAPTIRALIPLSYQHTLGKPNRRTLVPPTTIRAFVLY